MTNPYSYKSKQFFFVLVKISLVIAACAFIYYKLFYDENYKSSDWDAFLNESSVFSLQNLFGLFFLTAVNWFLEIIKWKTLVATFKKITILEALEQSLGSLTASIFTPNKIAEYGVKALYFAPNERKKIVLLKLIANLSQMMVTVVFGVIGLLVLISLYSFKVPILLWIFLGFSSLFTLWLTHQILSKKQLSYKGYTYQHLLSFFKSIPLRTYLKTGVFSFMRYLVFSFQFFVLLQLSGSTLSYLDSLSIISSMYLLSSIIPSIFIFDLMVKGSVAIYLFAFVGIDELTILGITTLMWIFNFAIPAILGSYFVLKFKFPTPLSA